MHVDPEQRRLRPQRSMYDRSGSLSTTRFTAASSTGSSSSAKLTVFGASGLTDSTGSNGAVSGTTGFGGGITGIDGSGVSTLCKGDGRTKLRDDLAECCGRKAIGGVGARWKSGTGDPDRDSMVGVAGREL